MINTRDGCWNCKSHRFWKKHQRLICGKRKSPYFGIDTMNSEYCEFQEKQKEKK